MTRWTRAHSDTLCGKCSARLSEGAAIQLVQLANVKRELVRGECCAGPAPPDLPARVVPRQTTKKMKPLALDKLTAAIANKNTTTLREWLPYPEDRESRQPGEDG